MPTSHRLPRLGSCALRTGALLAGALLAASYQAGALAAAPARPSVRMSAALSPESLGKATSISLTLQIGVAGGQAPPPLQQVSFPYPEGFGLAVSDLGIEECSARALEASGPAGCPADSVMGRGSALGEAPSASGDVHEQAKLTIVRTQNQHGHIAFLLDAEGLSPVKPNIVFSALLLPSRRPFGGEIRTQVPPVPTGSGGADVALVKLSVTIGPKAGLRYSERVRGKLVSYVPRGILLPQRCPRGGFPFAAEAAFAGHARASARARVACPRMRRRHERRGRSRSRA